MAYAALVDEAVESCRLATWNIWTSYAFAPTLRWPADLPSSIEQFANRVLGAVLTGRYPDFEHALQTLARSLHEAASHFLLHAEQSGANDILMADRFYNRLNRWDPPAYELLAAEYDKWEDECHALLILATKAGNWFAEEVRRSINPFFYLLEGKFLVTAGPDETLVYRTSLYEFTADEKREMPESLLTPIRERERERRRKYQADELAHDLPAADAPPPETP